MTDELRDHEFTVRIISRCRGCHKLVSCWGEWQNGELAIMTDGSPLFPPCPNNKKFPTCEERMPTEIIAWEEGDHTDTTITFADMIVPGGPFR
jgi:hypothetical protein